MRIINYTFTNETNTAIRVEDTYTGEVKFVPVAPGNRDYDEIVKSNVEIDPFIPLPTPIPTVVTPLQMRKALRLAGLKQFVDTYIDTLSEEAQEEWEYAVEVHRDNPFIENARIALGMSTEDADNLFLLASTL